MLYGKGASKSERDTAKKAAITILAKAGLTIDDWIVDVVTPQEFFFGGYTINLEQYFITNFRTIMGSNCKYERVYNPDTNIVHLYFEGTAEQKKNLLENAKGILAKYEGYKKTIGNYPELADYYTFTDYMNGDQMGTIDNLDKETQFRILDEIFARCKDRDERLKKLKSILGGQNPFRKDYVIERMKQIDPYIKVFYNKAFNAYYYMTNAKIMGAE